MKIRVKDLETNIEMSELMKNIFDVDFGGIMVQFKKQTLGGPFLKNAYKVNNAMNGYGQNCLDEFKNEIVTITN